MTPEEFPNKANSVRPLDEIAYWNVLVALSLNGIGPFKILSNRVVYGAAKKLGISRDRADQIISYWWEGGWWGEADKGGYITKNGPITLHEWGELWSIDEQGHHTITSPAPPNFPGLGIVATVWEGHPAPRSFLCNPRVWCREDLDQALELLRAEPAGTV